jgi:RNA polymerase sigma factor (sigma-70 family)
VAETSPEVTFDPTGLGYEEVSDFDPKALGYEEVGDFDPAQAGYEEVQEAEQTFGDKASRVMASAASQTLNTISGTTRLYQSSTLGKLFDEVANLTGIPTTQEFITELEGASSRASDDYGVNPKQGDSFLSTLASGAGSLLPTLASGPLAPFTTAVSMGEQGFQEADQAGATEGQKVTAFLGNAAVGAITEKLLGIPAILKSAKAAKLPEGTLGNLVKTVVKQMGLGFAREGTQETLEQLSRDTIAAYVSAYDPDRKVFDGKKLATTFLAGGLLGGALGGTLTIAENATPDQIAPKEEMQEQASQIDAQLETLAQPPPLTTSTGDQGVPVETTIEETFIPAEQLAQTPAAVAEPEATQTEETTPAQRAERLSPFEPQTEGPQIISTGIMTPEGIATGTDWNSSHAQIITKSETVKQALAFGMTPEELDANKGFIIQDESGKQRFVGRKEALEIAKTSGQVDESKIYTPEQGLISEGLKAYEKETPQATETVLDADQAALAIEPYREAGIAMAKRSGASDLIAEDIFQEVQNELYPKLASGEISPNKLGGLVSKAVREKTLNKIKSEQARSARQEAVAPPEVTTVGPRTETVVSEDVKTIEQALDKLPGNQGKAIRLTAEGKTNAQIASELGITEGAVEQTKARARQAMKEFIRSMGIGERLAPGAANELEFQRARYIAATDLYQESSSREEWEGKMNQVYEGAFNQTELDNAYAAAQLISEHKGTKSVSDMASQLLGLQQAGEGFTSITNKRIDKERMERGAPPITGLLKKSNPELWGEMSRTLDRDPQFQGNLVSRVLNDPTQPVSDLDQLALLHNQIGAKNDYDKATKAFNEAKSEQEKLILKERRNELSNELNRVEQALRFAGSSAGKTLQARKVVVANDYSVGRLLAELHADQGSPVTPDQVQLAQEVSETVVRTESELEARVSELETKESEKALDQKIKEWQQPLDSRILSIAQKLVNKLDSAADSARKRLLARRQTVHADPFGFMVAADLYDYAVIGASKIAHGLKDLAWRNSMKEEFGEELEPHLDQIFERADEMINQLENDVAEKDRPKVKRVVRKQGSEDIIKDTQSKIKGRISDGASLSDLKAYVQKMALAMVRSGINERNQLVDTLQPILDVFQPGITKREVMDLVSGYGDFKALDKDKAKVQLRDIKGQLQQVSKIEDLESRIPLKKTGVQRREVSDTERRLIKQVNELKKRLGVRVTDPETQLKSTLDSIKTNLRNQISDLTTQIETGEKPIPGTPAPTNEQIESMRALRDRIKQTLKDIDGTPEVSQEERIKNAEKGLERSIAELETRIKNKDYLPSQKDVPQSEKLKALRDRRDSLKADLDALREADTNLRDTQTFDRLIQQAAELESRLLKRQIQARTKAEKIEDDIVTEVREKIANLRKQMTEARRSSPEGQQDRLNKAIEAVERSISSLDSRLKAGDTETPGTPKGPTSPILERLRAERDAMRKLVIQLNKVQIDPEQSALKNYKSRLARQTAELQERIATGNFEPKVRTPLDISKDPEAVRIRAENAEARKRFEQARYEAQIKGENLAEKAFRLTTETLNAAKSSVGSVDLSAFARQSIMDTAAHPINAFKNLITSIQAMNEGELKKINAELELRPNARNGIYQMTGVDFTDLQGPLSKREEQFRSDWANTLPWVRWSSRQYTTFLNLARADAVDRALASAPVKPTKEQLKYIGGTVNTLTGRGDLGRFAGAADLLAIPLWSPRLYVSRIQTLLARPLWQKNAGPFRKHFAREYIRAAGSGLAVIALGILAGADIEKDPSSSDFMKLKFGNLRIDPWGGMQQWLVFLTRVISGDYKTTKGEEFDMSYPDGPPGPYDPTYGDVLSRMFRSKLNPIAQSVWSYHTGKDIQGKDVSAIRAIGSATLPLSFFNDDLVPIAKEFGVDKAALTQLLSILGIGVQHYDPDER